VYVMLYLYEFRVNNPSTVNTVKQLLSGGVMGYSRNQSIIY